MISTILFLGASPSGETQVAVEGEVRSIKALLERAPERGAFRFEQESAVRVGDLHGALLRHRPTIVHFRGHGNAGATPGLEVEDDAGNRVSLAPKALADLFRILTVRCVVLNACHTYEQAEAIREHVDCVVGMGNVIGHRAAPAFAASFYQALAFGRSVQTAFELGKNQIKLERLPEDGAPRLLSRDGVNADAVYFVQAETGRPPPRRPQPPDLGSLHAVVQGVPRTIGSLFKGREQSLLELHAALLGPAIDEARPPGRVFAYGGGGIGKSRLAGEYVWRYRSQYPGGVWFVTVGARAPLEIWAALAAPLLGGQNVTAADAARAFVASLADALPGPKLIVLDGVEADTAGDLADRFSRRVERGTEIWPLEHLTHVRFLVTTRRADFPDAVPFEVRGLDEQHARDLLVARSGRRQVPELDEPFARELAGRVLGGHPLALSIAGAYLGRVKGLSFEDYLKKVLEGPTQVLEDAWKHVWPEVRDHQRSIAATYDVSREALDLTDRVDALAWRSLVVASCLASNVPIDRRLLRSVLRDRAASSSPNVEEVGLAAARLVELSLLDASREDQGAGVGDVVIHPLVADYTRRVAGGAAIDAVRRGLLAELGELFPCAEQHYWKILTPSPPHGWERLSPAREAHVVEVWARTAPLHDEPRSVLGKRLADLYLHRGDRRRELGLARALLERDEQRAQVAPDDLAWKRRRFLGHARVGRLLLAHDADGALQAFRVSLALRLSLEGSDPSNEQYQHDVLVGHDCVGGALLALGDRPGALEAFRTCRDVAARLAQSGSPAWRKGLAVAHAKVADVLRDEGDHAGAVAGYEQSAAIEKVLVDEEPRDADRQSDLAATLSRIGKTQLAAGDRRGALEAFRTTLGIRARLVRQRDDQSNVPWQSELARSCVRVAELLTASREARRLLVLVQGLQRKLDTEARLRPDEIDQLVVIARDLLALGG